MKPPARPQRGWLGDTAGAGIAAALVAAAFVVPFLADETWRSTLYAGAAPIFGTWTRHVGPGTVPAVLVAAVVCWFGPRFALRASWRGLLGATWLAALAWAFALAMVDGWQRGFAGRLADPTEYLSVVGEVDDVGAMLRTFSDRILDFQPHSWPTHVAGHPPGALLVFVTLDRTGLTGPTWAAVFATLAGTSATVAVLIAVRALAGGIRARSLAPFLALAPTAIWIAVSADAVFTAVTAWAVALLACAARRRGRTSIAAGFAAGIGFGFGIYLNYGLVLMGLPALAVLAAGRTVRPLAPALAGALTVAVVFSAAGFWWFDGYHLVVERYYQGIAEERPFDYWAWANIAAAVCATGLAVPASLHRSLAPHRLLRLDGAGLLVASALIAIAAADLSALSKAETERIWLPFTTWLLVSAAFLPARYRRRWLIVQSAGALVLVHLVLTRW